MKKWITNLIAKTIGMYINILSYIAPKKSLRLAYNLFSQPRKGKLKSNKLPESLKNAKQEVHSLNNQLFYTHTWTGNQEIILLVHGWESNASRWEQLLPFIQKTGKTIIAIDGPAHGLTSGKEFNVPIYSEFIHQLVIKYNPEIVIGHSVGGNTLAHYQAHYPHNLKKMILLGSPSDFNIILENYCKLLGLNSKVHDYLKQYTKERFNFFVDDFSASSFLQKTTILGIVAHDIEDDVVLFEEGKKIANSWKTAEFIQTKGLGHSMHDDGLYQKIVEFIQ